MEEINEVHLEIIENAINCIQEQSIMLKDLPVQNMPSIEAIEKLDIAVFRLELALDSFRIMVTEPGIPPPFPPVKK